MTIRGGNCQCSSFNNRTLARRLQHFEARAQTCVDFEPNDFQEIAGLTAFYDTNSWYTLAISWHEELGKVLKLTQIDDDGYVDHEDTQVALPEGPVHLRLIWKRDQIEFFYSHDEENWTAIGPVVDGSILSDEYGNGHSFTGAFVGMTCQDLSGREKPAKFDYFDYEVL